MVNLLGTGGTDLRLMDLDFDFWMGATSTSGAGIGIFGRVPHGISGGAALEGPATSQHGGIAKAVALLSFWFFKNTASILHCAYELEVVYVLVLGCQFVCSATLEQKLRDVQFSPQ